MKVFFSFSFCKVKLWILDCCCILLGLKLKDAVRRLNIGRQSQAQSVAALLILTSSTRPVHDENRRAGAAAAAAMAALDLVLPTASFSAQDLQVSAGGDRRGGHARTSRAASDPVLLRASEMTRPLHFCCRPVCSPAFHCFCGACCRRSQVVVADRHPTNSLRLCKTC